MQSLSQPSVKCGNSVSKLSSDPIPSVKLRPGSKWAGSRRRGFAGEEREGWGGGWWWWWWWRGISSLMSCRVCRNPACSPRASWRRVQAWVPAERSLVPACRSKSPLSVCLCGGEAVAQLPWAPAQSFEDKMVIQSPFRYVANRWSLCDTHASLYWSLQLKHLWSLLKRIGCMAWGQIRLWMGDKILDHMFRIFFFTISCW